MQNDFVFSWSSACPLRHPYSASAIPWLGIGSEFSHLDTIRRRERTILSFFPMSLLTWIYILRLALYSCPVEFPISDTKRNSLYSVLQSIWKFQAKWDKGYSNVTHLSSEEIVGESKTFFIVDIKSCWFWRWWTIFSKKKWTLRVLDFISFSRLGVVFKSNSMEISIILL